MHLGMVFELRLVHEVRLRLAARIVELWADPWRRLEPGPEPMTAEEIAGKVGASPSAVRRLFATGKGHAGATKSEGRPTRWSVVIPRAESADDVSSENGGPCPQTGDSFS